MDKYYREQLQLLRDGAAAFAKSYPAIAPMLLAQGSDPDVERILEGTAYLCGKIRERLDQTAPNLIQSLSRLLCPQSLLPLPSSTILQFKLASGFTQPLVVPEGTRVASVPVDKVSCPYSTIGECVVQPLSIEGVSSVQTPEGTLKLTVSLESSAPIGPLNLSHLRFFVLGSYAVASQRLYSILECLQALEVQVGGATTRLPTSCVEEHFFSLTDSRLVAKAKTKHPYLDICRYFIAPDELLFFQVKGLENVAFSESDTSFQLHFYLSKGVDPSLFTPASFAINAVPAINVFNVSAEPINVSHTQEEYGIRPQSVDKKFLEILDIASMEAFFFGGKVETCLPYHAFGSQKKGILYSTRFRPRGTAGLSEHLITPLYAGTAYEARQLKKMVLSGELLCCHHTIPSSLRIGDVCLPTDSTPSQVSCSNISTPTPFCPRTLDESVQWRFLSFLNANFSSFSCAESLQSFLESHLPRADIAPEIVAMQQRRCHAIKSLKSSREDLLFKGRLLSGLHFYLSLDASGFVSDGDVWLFAGAIDRLLSFYADINTFTHLTARNESTGKEIEWPPRLGESRLI